MAQPFILSIDQGTTGTTILVIGEDGGVIETVSQDFPQHFPQPGWVEHDPDDIWRSVLDLLQRLVEEKNCDMRHCAGIGITNQRETAVIWSAQDGTAPHRAIVWQDRRTAKRCADLRAQGNEQLVRSRTGLVLDPYFSGTKYRWLLDAVDGHQAAKERRLLIGTVDSYLMHKLTAGALHATDVTNASRSLLFDIHTCAWDSALCDLFGVPIEALPDVRGCSEIYGSTKHVPSLPDGIPIAGVAGDQHAALFGQACYHVGDAKCTYGTGAFLLVNVGDKPQMSKHGLLSTPAWQLNGRTTYALEGSAFVAGSAVQWLRDGLGLIEKSEDIEALARSVESSGGVSFVPALAGLGAPHWDPDARGLLCGLTRGTTKAHIAYAVLEGIAHQIVDLGECMAKDLGRPLVEAIRLLRVDGGAAENDLLMQLQSDLIGLDVQRPNELETTAIGAGYLAGLAVGFFPDLETLAKVSKVERSFKPAKAGPERDEARREWQASVRRALSTS